ncbi:hypothetical protein EVAR_11425_1 [Eumeta japonica]|uniref:Uncharacterized protein n=1 Tax=Eumeta variegata TaxID=151549 RepID=A0A4C1TM31_EUMVA|nr:hypothetical protein EVAR_11425_1 [Eumeta japonica]
MRTALTKVSCGSLDSVASKCDAPGTMSRRPGASRRTVREALIYAVATALNRAARLLGTDYIHTHTYSDTPRRRHTAEVQRPILGFGVKAKRELFATKAESGGAAERKLSSSSGGSMKNKWLKAFRSLKPPSAPPAHQAPSDNNLIPNNKLAQGWRHLHSDRFSPQRRIRFAHESFSRPTICMHRARTPRRKRHLPERLKRIGADTEAVAGGR